MSNLKKWFSFLAFCWAGALMAQAPFQLGPLPYAYDALEPYIDAQTMEIHYSKHHQGYVDNLNKAIEGTAAAQLSLENILQNISQYSDAVRNNAGGHYNHTLFWTILTPRKDTKPSARLLAAIEKTFGSFDNFKMQMSQAAMQRFGSGWAWLCVDDKRQLFISSTPNQDNPLMDVVDKRGTPILGIDVWEHAYYLKYQNRRGDYLSAIWHVVNWEEVSRRYDELVPRSIFEEWQAIASFHEVMSHTFHASEAGDLQPIRQRSSDMLQRARSLKTSPIPAEFNTKDIRKAIDELVRGSERLHRLVQSRASDASITQSLNQLHDVFHRIVGLCRDEHAKHSH